MICAGLGKYFLSDGRKTGFFKPIITKNGAPKKEDDDTLFLKQVLALEEPLDKLSKVVADGAPKSEVKEALAKISKDKDIVIVEGWGKLDSTSLEMATTLSAGVIIIETYDEGLSRSKLASKYKDFGQYLIGVVVNKVPLKVLPSLKDELLDNTGKTGLSILGVLPEDRILLSLTIGELAKYIRGEILNDTDKEEELVENFMLGAMNVGSGVEYFDLKATKAAIVNGERSDIQLAALETKTKCLILSDNAELQPAVLSRAKIKGTPIIRVKDNTETIVTRIEAALGKTKFGQEKKLPKLAQILEQNLDFKAVKSSLGFSG